MPDMPEMKLELVPVPVTDVDRARDFYVNQIGFHLDHDVNAGEGTRIIQLTPPGSGCSILLSFGMGEISEMKPGSLKGLHLVVKDVAEIRKILLERGVAVGEVIAYPQGIKYVHFSDPDGNAWAVQEIPRGI